MILPCSLAGGAGLGESVSTLTSFSSFRFIAAGSPVSDPRASALSGSPYLSGSSTDVPPRRRFLTEITVFLRL